MSEFRILVVDESPTVVGMLSYVLESLGYAVETAGDGVEAVKTALRFAPDLVLIDVRTPGMTGSQVCRVLKDEPRTRGASVVLLSSTETGVERIHALRAGADRLLLKESAPEEVAQAVREALSGKRPRPAPPAPAAEPTDVEILSRINAILESKLFESVLLNEISRVGKDAEEFEPAIRAIDVLLREILPHDAMAAVFSDGIYLESVLVYPYEVGERVRAATAQWTERLREDAGVPAAPNRVRLSEFPLEGKRPKEGPTVELYRPWMVCPVRSGEMVRGLVALFSDEAGVGAGDGRASAETILRHSFTVMENAWLFSQISRLSVTDGLTGLFNHRHFMEEFKKERARSARYREALSILMVDVDHFKKINDVYGHPVGDTVLREMAALLAGQCRDTDLPARYGGEEFVLLLPKTPCDGAALMAERVRQAIEQKVFAAPSPLLHVTASIGVSAFNPEAPLSDKEILALADEALYEAKRGGRNRVCRKG